MIPMREIILDRERRCGSLLTNPLFHERPPQFQIKQDLGMTLQCSEHLKPRLSKAGWWGGWGGGVEGRATVMETSDSKWFSTIQPAQHGCPLSWHTHTKRMDPSASCCTTPFLSFLSNSIPQCTCLVRERERKRREGIPFDLDRHANVGGHATAMEHPTAQQHRGPGSLTACANL